MQNRLILILSLIIFFSCENRSEDKKEPPEIRNNSVIDLPSLNGTWKLLKVNDTLFSIEEIYPYNYGRQPTIIINISEHKIGGYTGCNSWGTKLRFSENSLNLKEPIEMTQQGCPGIWESQFLKFLKDNRSISLDKQYLKLTSIDYTTMTFKRCESN